MEFMEGRRLSDVAPELDVKDIMSVLRQLVQLEARMMSFSFPAGGSLYYTKDLEKMGGKIRSIPLNDEQFCIGLDAGLHMWFGRRSQLDVERGPCRTMSYFGDSVETEPHKYFR